MTNDTTTDATTFSQPYNNTEVFTPVNLARLKSISYEYTATAGSYLYWEKLSEMIGATRESINRMLGEFKKQDVIDYQDNLIIIKNLSYLKEICHCENCPGNICRM